MNALKSLVLNRFKILFLLSVAMGLSLVLLMIRMKLNQSFYLLFLVCLPAAGREFILGHHSVCNYYLVDEQTESS